MEPLSRCKQNRSLALCTSQARRHSERSEEPVSPLVPVSFRPQRGICIPPGAHVIPTAGRSPMHTSIQPHFFRKPSNTGLERVCKHWVFVPPIIISSVFKFYQQVVSQMMATQSTTTILYNIAFQSN